jgi:hypothetical protein
MPPSVGVTHTELVEDEEPVINMRKKSIIATNA